LNFKFLGRAIQRRRQLNNQFARERNLIERRVVILGLELKFASNVQVGDDEGGGGVADGTLLLHDASDLKHENYPVHQF
jgi:hypothetical protein